MKRLLALAAMLAVAACTSAPSITAADPNTIEVMILGTFHMDNPGADLNNVKVDPVTTPKKQAELQQVADALARFKPTAIAVERIAKDPATMLDHRYPEFKPADLLTKGDERIQVGYRLAAQLNLDRVYGIDEQDHDGEISYFPYELVDAWATAHGRANDLQSMSSGIQKQLAEFETLQKTETIGRLLHDYNKPEGLMSEGGNGFYMNIMKFGGGADQPGAILNGRWYTRNAVIFSKLLQVAKPGDRIIVIYGAGHSYWLRNLVKQMPGFKLVEATDYLPTN
ncbi:MAG: DUF5694 domain-containing protein [Hyphomonadaceae bacterium]